MQGGNLKLSMRCSVNALRQRFECIIVRCSKAASFSRLQLFPWAVNSVL